MRLANQQSEIEAKGAELMALSVDSQERNAALARRWKLPFQVVSDPGGERFLQALDLWNDKERGGIAWPAVLLISADGQEVHRERSNDFADRTHDDDALEALNAQGWTAVSTEPWQAEAPEEGSDELAGAFPIGAFKPLMNGNFYGAIAINQRVEHPESRELVKQHGAMAKSFVDAWDERRKL